jgi:DNA-binding transcriptional regulator YiaG
MRTDRVDVRHAGLDTRTRLRCLMANPLLSLEHFLALKCKHNKSECARRLGVSRVTLDNWLNGVKKPSPLAKLAAKTKGVDLER